MSVFLTLGCQDLGGAFFGTIPLVACHKKQRRSNENPSSSMPDKHFSQYFIFNSQHHYTVREIEVTSRCDCNGHANGTHCPLNQSTSLRTCQCEGNTCGAHCDECCPLYNQFPWKIGNGAPWINDPAAKCERKQAWTSLKQHILDSSLTSIRTCYTCKLMQLFKKTLTY